MWSSSTATCRKGFKQHFIPDSRSSVLSNLLTEIAAWVEDKGGQQSSVIGRRCIRLFLVTLKVFQLMRELFVDSLLSDYFTKASDKLVLHPLIPPSLNVQNVAARAGFAWENPPSRIRHSLLCKTRTRARLRERFTAAIAQEKFTLGADL